MEVYRFEKSKATPAHNGTIWAAPVLEGSVRPPFDHAWGYLDTPTALEPHAHAHEEVYMVFAGEGVVTVGEESRPVRAGDVINIPSGVTHSIANTESKPLKWAAFWWNREE